MVLMVIATLCGGRTGGSSTGANGSNTPNAMNGNVSIERRNFGLVFLGVLTILGVLYVQREHLAIFTDSAKLQEATLDVLNSLRPDPGQDEFQALTLYMFGLFIWSCLGLMTIPIETAAGMVFGWSAFPFTWVGKVAGFLVAFWAGRSCLATWANAKLSKYSLFQTLNSSTTTTYNINGDGETLSNAKATANIDTPSGSDKQPLPDEEMGVVAGVPRRRRPTCCVRQGGPAYSPLSTSPDSTSAKSSLPDCTNHQWFAAYMTAFMVRFALIPETIKNFGSAVLPIIRWWHYLLACSIHGGYLTMLWTWLGVETAHSLRKDEAGLDDSGNAGEGGGTSTGLAIAFGMGGLVIFVLSPLCLAWWIRRLHRAAAAGSVSTSADGKHATQDSAKRMVMTRNDSCTSTSVCSTVDEGGCRSEQTGTKGGSTSGIPLSKSSSCSSEEEMMLLEDESIRSRASRKKHNNSSHHHAKYLHPHMMIHNMSSVSATTTDGAASAGDDQSSLSDNGIDESEREHVELIHRVPRKSG